MNSTDLERALPDEEVNFLPVVNSKNQNNINNECSSDALLTREDLLSLDKREPKWRRLRLILHLGFWIIWFGLLISSVVVIVLSPKCPPVPVLHFWQSKPGYWVDPFAYRDSTKNLIGDLKGLTEKIKYIKDTIGAGFLILDSFVNGQYSNNDNRLGLTTDFKVVDPVLGTNDDFRSLLKVYHKEGMHVVISLDINSVSTTHGWASKYSINSPRKWFTRSGTETNPGRYSAFGHGTVDLDLTNPNLIKELQGVAEYWLREGADGILLSNAAFYVEDLGKIPVDGQNWVSTAADAQIFQSRSVDVVYEIRKAIDQISSTTGKPRLLAVDPGNTGLGTSSDDKALGFLGNATHSGAHIIFSRQFVNRQTAVSKPINSYHQIYADNKPKLALATATPSDIYHDNVAWLASIFLLPGTPIIYYGSELGQALSGNPDSNLRVYPKTKRPLVDDQLFSHLPMPWDVSGKGFSEDYGAANFPALLQSLQIKETVETATAAGRGPIPFTLVQSLIQLRKKPSLLWGDFELLKIENLDPSINAEMFARKAEGYPPFVSVIVDTKAPSELLVRFPDYCKSFVPRIVYPGPSNLELDKKIEINRVFLSAAEGPAVYVFECL